MTDFENENGMSPHKLGSKSPEGTNPKFAAPEFGISPGAPVPCNLGGIQDY